MHVEMGGPDHATPVYLGHKGSQQDPGFTDRVSDHVDVAVVLYVNVVEPVLAGALAEGVTLAIHPQYTAVVQRQIAHVSHGAVHVDRDAVDRRIRGEAKESPVVHVYAEGKVDRVAGQIHHLGISDMHRATAVTNHVLKRQVDLTARGRCDNGHLRPTEDL